MRRKSNRGTPKKVSPEKNSTAKKPRRQSRRGKQSDDSDESDEEMPQAPEMQQSEPKVEDEPEIDSTRSRRRKNVVNYAEDDDSPPRRRGRSQNDDEEKEEKKGKGKSKSKNKSKIEKSSNIEPLEVQARSEISENVQVTAQSPTNPDCENANNICVQSVNEADDDKSCESTHHVEEKKSDEINSLKNDKIPFLEEQTVAEDLSKSQTSPKEAPAVQDEIVAVETEAVAVNTEAVAVNTEAAVETEAVAVKTDAVAEVKEIESASEPAKVEIVEDSPKDYEKEDSVNTEDKSNDSVPVSAEIEKVEEDVGKVVIEKETEKEIEKVNDKEKENNKLEARKRRFSSAKAEVEKEVKVKKSSKRIKLNRNLSEPATTPAKPRQKWTKSGLNLTNSIHKVDVETLKNVCPKLEFLSETEVQLEPVERRKSTTTKRMSIASEDSDIKQDDEVIELTDSETTSNIIAMNRKISIVDDTASKLKPPPSPAKNDTSDILFITNLVRPFTIKQLKELLERTGKLREGGFWTDRIKSKCYVHYESVEEAEATRNALHGVNWPIGNGKKLMIDYGTVEELEKARNPPVVIPAPVIPAKTEKEKENKQPDGKTNEPEVKEERENGDKRRKSESGHVREWDLGKEDLHRKRSTSRSRERVRTVSRRTASPVEDFISKKNRKQEEVVPQKLMDDLFLKTKATPSIYWQPLTPEEIATKQQQRLVRMEEHKRRMEENARNRVGRNDSGGVGGSGGGGRGPNFRRR